MGFLLSQQHGDRGVARPGHRDETRRGFDFDVHHGNGTEAILLNKPGANVFLDSPAPCYPGTGTRNVGDNCFNYPVAPHTPREEYRKVLSRALDDLKNPNPNSSRVAPVSTPSA